MSFSKRCKFRSRIDDYSNITELNADTDRIVRTTFTLNLAGYIITDSINKAIANRTPKTFSPFAIRFTQEVVIPTSTTPTSIPLSSGAVDTWILQSGFWDDRYEWLDIASWID